MNIYKYLLQDKEYLIEAETEGDALNNLNKETGLGMDFILYHAVYKGQSVDGINFNYYPL